MNKRAESALEELWVLFMIVKIIGVAFLILFVGAWVYYWITGEYLKWPF